MRPSEVQEMTELGVYARVWPLVFVVDEFARRSHGHRRCRNGQKWWNMWN